MKITAKEAKRLTTKVTEAGWTGSILEYLCGAIEAAAKNGRNSVIIRGCAMSDDDWQWLAINGFEVFKRQEFQHLAYLISWEFASK